MATINVNPIPYNPGNSATGKAYTPDTLNNYISIPGITVTADLSIPSETFVGTYTPAAGKVIDHAMGVIKSSAFSTASNTGTLDLTFTTQVFYTDNTNDINDIVTGMTINMPADFTAFSLVGPFKPVIPAGGVTAVVNALDATKIDIRVTINAFVLPSSGTATVKVRAATGTF